MRCSEFCFDWLDAGAGYTYKSSRNCYLHNFAYILHVARDHITGRHQDASRNLRGDVARRTSTRRRGRAGVVKAERVTALDVAVFQTWACLSLEPADVPSGDEQNEVDDQPSNSHADRRLEAAVHAAAYL